MAYFSYHAMAKKLIAEGHLIDYEIRDSWNKISPALRVFDSCNEIKSP